MVDFTLSCRHDFAFQILYGSNWVLGDDGIGSVGRVEQINEFNLFSSDQFCQRNVLQRGHGKVQVAANHRG